QAPLFVWASGSVLSPVAVLVPIQADQSTACAYCRPVCCKRGVDDTVARRVLTSTRRLLTHVLGRPIQPRPIRPASPCRSRRGPRVAWVAGFSSGGPAGC